MNEMNYRAAIDTLLNDAPDDAMKGIYLLLLHMLAGAEKGDVPA